MEKICIMNILKTNGSEKPTSSYDSSYKFDLFQFLYLNKAEIDVLDTSLLKMNSKYIRIPTP